MSKDTKKPLPAKFSKKDLGHLVEAKITIAISEILNNGSQISKQLQKLVKKAGKSISAELHKGIKEKEKAPAGKKSKTPVVKKAKAAAPVKKASVAKKSVEKKATPLP